MIDTDVILLVEDTEDDVHSLQSVFRKANVPNPIHAVNNAEEAIDYLSGTGKYSDRERYPMPSIVLLDLKLPGKDGFDVLEWAAMQASLKQVYFIVLTGLETPSDIDRAYKMGATSYLVKPFTPYTLKELIDTLKAYRRKRGY